MTKRIKTTDLTHYIVKISSAKMPNNCWGRYEHVAVLEVDADRSTVPAIDDRAKYVKRIVRTWRNRCVGTTPRSASWQAEDEASNLAARLNDRATERNAMAQREAHRTEGC